MNPRRPRPTWDRLPWGGLLMFAGGLAAVIAVGLTDARRELALERQVRCEAELRLARYEQPAVAAAIAEALVTTVPERRCILLEDLRHGMFP